MNSSSSNGLVDSVYKGHRARLLIADDHVLIAEACRSLLEPEFDVVGIVADGRSLVELAAELRPDVVILDISMPELNGLDAGERIKSTKRDAKLIYMTVASGADVAAEAFRRGASGYVLKHGDVEELRIAVRRALRGEAYVSPLLDKDGIEFRLRSGAEYHPEKTLTFRQREILQLVVEGNTLRKIANILKIKPGTVAFHKYRIMERLGIETTAGLIDYAINRHIVSKDSKNAIQTQSTCSDSRPSK